MVALLSSASSIAAVLKGTHDLVPALVGANFSVS